jgi:hypothetical protein
MEATAVMIEDHKSIGSDAQKNTRAARGRMPAYESRAQEIRARLLVWKRPPESMRQWLRELARELHTSHQMLGYFLNRLPKATSIGEWS